MSEYGVVKCDNCKRLVNHQDESIQIQMKPDELPKNYCIDCIELLKLGQVCSHCGHWALLTNGSYVDELWVCDNCQIARVNQ